MSAPASSRILARAALALVLLALLVPCALCMDVSHELPAQAVQNEPTIVRLHLTSLTPGTRIVIGELPGHGATTGEWDIAGAAPGAKLLNDGEQLIWDFQADAFEATISYSVSLPANGTQTFDAVYAAAPDLSGHARDELLVLPAPAAQAPAKDAQSPLQLPSLELPAPVPAFNPSPVNFGVAFLLIASMIGLMLLYLRMRVREYDPEHVSFLDRLSLKLHSRGRA